MTAPLLSFQLLPERASDLARSVDAIFWSLMALCGLVAAGICIAIVVCCVRYREESPAVHRRFGGSSLTLEIIWTSATLVAFVAIFFWASAVYVHMSRPPANAVEVHVVAKQWMWKAQHLDGRREIDELHLLLGQPVKLTMTSQDVIHDFFVPAFRTKQDVLPDRYTTEWFTPTKPGKYHLFCAEYCGLDHSRMGGWVYVLEPVEYARWLAGQPVGESIFAQGERLYRARGCSGCHEPHSAVHAPSLVGIYRKPVALADRSVVIADEQYLHDSILQPSKQITAGYENLMPTFAGQLTQEEVMALVAYIKGLSAENTPHP
jgi:cytochrome c oxidase subunit 2